MTSDRERKEAAGRWLRRTREQKGFATIGALARRMGASESLISRIETGASWATDERAEQAAEALGMDLIDVRRGLGLWVPREATDEELENAYDEFEPGLLIRRVEELIRRRKEREVDQALKLVEGQVDRDAG